MVLAAIVLQTRTCLGTMLTAGSNRGSASKESKATLGTLSVSFMRMCGVFGT